MKDIKQLLPDIFFELLRQLTGVQKRRKGILILTSQAFRKMSRYHINQETLENAFRHGEEYKPGMIIHRYANYIIGLYYKWAGAPVRTKQPSEFRYVITTCWKGR